MADARACPPEPNDARWLAAELPDAFGDIDADMRRAAPAVSKAIDVALEDGSDEELELGAFRKCGSAGGTRLFGPTGENGWEMRAQLRPDGRHGSKGPWVGRSYSEANAPLRSSRLRWPPAASPGRWWECGT
jgi:hypothetical protein